MLGALPAAGSLGVPAPSPGAARAAAPQAAADPFGPAVTIGPAAPSSVFVVYDAAGALAQTSGAANPIVAPAPTASFADVPFSVLFNRLDDSIRQVQLNARGGAAGFFYSIGYLVLV